MREAVFTARARLKQAELEAEQWKEELRRLQAHSQEQGQQIHTLRQERQVGQEKTNRLVCFCKKKLHVVVYFVLVVCLFFYFSDLSFPVLLLGCSMRCLYCSSSCARAGSSFTPCRVSCMFTIECAQAQMPTKVSPSLPNKLNFMWSSQIFLLWLHLVVDKCINN